MNWLKMTLIIGSAGLIGCGGGNNNTGPLALSQDRADQLNSQHSSFDGAEPAINANTRFAAGQLAESQDAPVRAIEQYQQALKLDPKHEKSMYRLAVLYTIVKEYPKAIETWERYIKLTNGAAEAYSNLGFCNELAGRFDTAEAAYRKGIEKDPTNASCRTNYGLMLARHDKFDEAKAQLSQVLNPAEVHYNLGSVYEFRGMKAQARSEYSRALQIDKEMADAKTRLAALDQN